MISTKMFFSSLQSSSRFFSSSAKQSPFSTLEEVKTTINERIKVNEREGTNKFLVEDKNLIHLHMSEMNSLSAFLHKRGYGSTFFFYADNLPIIELNSVGVRDKTNSSRTGVGVRDKTNSSRTGFGVRDKTNSSRTGFGVRDHYYDSYYGYGI